MTLRNTLLGISAIAVSAAFGAQASAQSLDYQSLSGLFGEPVTAGATGAPQRASDVPATMIIITQDDIRDAPEYDIPGILRHYAGVDSDRYMFGQGEVSIRGYNQAYAPRLLVLVNGRQVYLDHYGYTNWSAIPVQLNEIQQIEIVKGPQSALYGFNAVSGVVNIITRNPQFGEYMTGQVNVGDGGYQDASAVLGYQFSDTASLRASIGISQSNQFDAGPFGDIPGATTTENYVADLDFERFTAAAELRARVGTATDVSFEVTYSEVDSAEMFPLFFAGGSQNELYSLKGEVVSDTDFGIITARAYHNNLDVGYTTDDSLNYDDVALENEVTVFQLQDIFKVGRANTFRLGFEWRENVMTSTPDQTNGDVSYTVTAFSGMWNRQLNSDWSLTVAGRYDQLELQREGAVDPFYLYTQADYDRSIEEFSYNASLAWKVDQMSTLRLSAGRGVQAPTLIELGFTLSSAVNTPFGLMNVPFEGNPNIDPTIIDSYEIAYDRQLSPNMTLRTALFHVETSDIKGFFGSTPDWIDPTSMPPLGFTFSNQGDSSMTGFEASLEGESGPWDWYTGYTYLNVEDDLSVNQAGVTHPIMPETSTPEHRFNANLTWTGERWSAGGFFNYVSDTTMPREFAFGLPSSVDVDAFSSLSFRTGYKISENAEIALTGQNVNYGDSQAVTSGPAVETRYWLTLRASR